MSRSSESSSSAPATGTSAMPHFGQLPGFGLCTSGCVGDVYSAAVGAGSGGAGFKNFSGSALNRARQCLLQKKCLVPACSCEPAAFSGSTVIPHTGSIAITAFHRQRLNSDRLPRQSATAEEASGPYLGTPARTWKLAALLDSRHCEGVLNLFGAELEHVAGLHLIKQRRVFHLENHGHRRHVEILDRPVLDRDFFRGHVYLAHFAARQCVCLVMSLVSPAG